MAEQPSVPVERPVLGDVEALPDGEAAAAKAALVERGLLFGSTYLKGWADCLARQRRIERAEVERELDSEILDLSRSQPIGDRVAPRITIRIGEVFPDAGVEEGRELFREQGEALEAALWCSLPGGTVDALIVSLLERRASRFRVGFGTEADYKDRAQRLVVRELSDSLAAAAAEREALRTENAQLRVALADVVDHEEGASGR